MQTQIRRRITRRLIRVCTVCLNYRKISLHSRPFSQPGGLHSETIDPSVLWVLWFWYLLFEKELQYEPGHNISYKIACAPNEDKEQPVGFHRLISVFAVRLKTAWIPGYPQIVLQKLIRLRGHTGWSESSLGTHAGNVACFFLYLYQSTCIYRDRGIDNIPWLVLFLHPES